MARSSRELKIALRNAKTTPVIPLGNQPRHHAEALADRRDAISDMEQQLAQRLSEEAGAWNG